MLSIMANVKKFILKNIFLYLIKNSKLKTGIRELI